MPDFIPTREASSREEPTNQPWGFRHVLIASALFIAGCSAYFSVHGLGLLFAGSEVPVMVMAASLEVGKLVAASFLVRYWDVISRSLRVYLSLAVIALIAITSQGIYGYLSRAYENTTKQIRQNEQAIASLEKEIAQDQNRIDDSREKNTRLNTASREDLAKAQARLTQATESLNVSLARLQEQRKSLNERRAFDLAHPTERASSQSATLAKSIAAEEASVARSLSSEEATIAGLNERIKVLDQAVAAYTAQGTTSQFLFFDKDNVKKGQDLRTEQQPERTAITAKLTESAARIERLRNDSNARIAYLRTEQSRLNADTGKEVSSVRQQFGDELARVDAEERELRKTGAANITDLEKQLAALQEQGQGKATMTDSEIEKLRKSVGERNKQIHTLKDQIASVDIGAYRFVARAFDVEADDVVKWLILSLIAVFDPLAVALVVGFNMADPNRKKRRAEVDLANADARAHPNTGAARPARSARPWAAWEITIVIILTTFIALIFAWMWTDTRTTQTRHTNVSTASSIPYDSFAVVTLRPDDLRLKSTKAFPDWLERAGGKGMSAAFAELLKSGLDAHSEIYAFAKFPSTPGANSNTAHPVMICGVVLNVTDPSVAEAALSRIADQMNNAISGEPGRPPSNLTRNRSMVKHGEGRYMDPEKGFFTFGLTNRTAIILVEFEGNPHAPCVEQEIRQCLLRPEQRLLRPGEKQRDRLPAYVHSQPGALTLWLDANRFYHRLPMSVATHSRFEQMGPSLDFELMLSLKTSGNDSLVLSGSYLYQFDRFAEGAPRDPLAVISKLTPPKNTDIGWTLLNRGADTIDYEAMVERMRSALSDGKTPGAQRVLVEKSIPTPRDARFTMNARFDPKAGPPILAAMSILAQ
jgi:hypothetical protein